MPKRLSVGGKFWMNYVFSKYLVCSLKRNKKIFGTAMLWQKRRQKVKLKKEIKKRIRLFGIDLRWNLWLIKFVKICSQ